MLESMENFSEFYLCMLSGFLIFLSISLYFFLNFWSMFIFSEFLDYDSIFNMFYIF
jgi:hypothetical protein